MFKLAQIIFLFSGLDFTEIKGFTIKTASFTATCVVCIYLIHFLFTGLLVIILILNNVFFINSAVVVYLIEKLFPIFIHVFLLLNTVIKCNVVKKLHKNLEEIDCDLIEIFNGDIFFKSPLRMLIVNLIVLIATRALMASIIDPLFMLSTALSELILSINDLHFKFHLDSLTERLIKLNSFISSSSKPSVERILKIRNLTMKMQSYAESTNDYFSSNVFVTISFNFLSIIISMHWIFIRLVYTKMNNIDGKIVFKILCLLINLTFRFCILFVSYSTNSMFIGNFLFLFKMFK